MKSILNKFAIYLLNLIAAIWVGILATFAATLLFKLFVPEFTLLQTRIINGSAHTVGTLVWLYLSSKKIGYEQKDFHPATTILSVGIVFVLQAILAYLMKFMIYIAGPIAHFAQAISAGNKEIYWQDWSEAPLGLYYGLLIAFDWLCLIAILLGEKAGNRKHIKDFAQTAKKSVAMETSSVPVYGRAASSPAPVQAEVSQSTTVPKPSILSTADADEEYRFGQSLSSADPQPTQEASPKSARREIPLKKSKRPQIPKECADLRRKVQMRIIPSIVAGILSTVAFIVLETITIINNPENPSRILNSTILFTLLCLAPIAAFKTWERITDRSFEGQVVEMEFQHKIKAGLDRRVQRYTVAKLKVREDSGKIIGFEYLVKGAVPFHPGNRIRHYAATDFMYLLDPDKPIVCVNCGNHYSATPEIHSDEDALFDWRGIRDPMAHIPDHCGFCKMSIIKRPPPEKEEQNGTE